MKAGAEDPAGTVYFVNGGAGAPLYGAGSGPATAFSKSAYGYSTVSVDDTGATIIAWELVAGQPTQIDRVVLPK